MAPSGGRPEGKESRVVRVKPYRTTLGPLTTNSVVDQETRKNNLDIVREALKVTNEFPIERADDFSFAKKADSERTQAGWKP